MEYDYSKLSEKITSVLGSREAFAGKMNISSQRVENILNSKAFFTQKEIDRAADLLGVSGSEIDTVFFTHKVQKV